MSSSTAARVPRPVLHVTRSTAFLPSATHFESWPRAFCAMEARVPIPGERPPAARGGREGGHSMVERDRTIVDDAERVEVRDGGSRPPAGAPGEREQSVLRETETTRQL